MTTIKLNLIILSILLAVVSCRDKYSDKIYTLNEITIKTVQYAEVDYSNIFSIWAEEFNLDPSFVPTGNTILRTAKRWGIGDMDTDLKMKVYSPPSKKWGTRPVVILFHGGGFVTGDMDNPSIKILCNEFAQRGYVAITVQYRKMNWLTPSLAKAGYTATQDARAAVRYVANHSKELGVNPNNIFLGGVSAGGCLALQTAFYDKGEDIEQRTSKLDRMYGHIDCIGEKQVTNFTIKAVLNIAGAIGSLDWIDNNNISVISFYGEKDNIIPDRCGVPFPNQGKKYDKVIKRIKSLLRKHKKLVDKITEAHLFEVCSSKEIHIRLKKNNVQTICHEYKGEDHSFMVSSNGNLTTPGQTTVEMAIQFFKEQL